MNAIVPTTKTEVAIFLMSGCPFWKFEQALTRVRLAALAVAE
ncbi:hypothetical protein [Caulobacter zeae]|nr:hypothetical protein [Caulobacter zeae]